MATANDIFADFDAAAGLGAAAPAQSPEPVPASTPATYYSLGRDVGGPDENQDRYTNQGLAARGVLLPGVVAVNQSKYPIGTVFRDQDTGEAFLAADLHGNEDPNVVDFYESPSRYKARKDARNLAVVGQLDTIPKDAAGVREALKAYGKIPEGESAEDWLAGRTGKTVAADELFSDFDSAAGLKQSDASAPAADLAPRLNRAKSAPKLPANRVDAIFADFDSALVTKPEKQSTAAPLEIGPKEDDINPVVEFGARVTRGARSGYPDSRAGIYDSALGLVEGAENPYRGKSLADLERERQQAEDELDALTDDRGEGGAYLAPSPRVGELRDQLAKIEAAKQGAPAGVAESLAGGFRAAADEARQSAADQREGWGKWIDPAHNQDFLMTLADSTGGSLPSTGAAMLSGPLGLVMMYGQQYEQSRQEYVKAREAKGLPASEQQARAYATAQAAAQTPWEVVGDVAMATALKRTFRGLFKDGVPGARTLGKWLGQHAKELATATAGETLVTTPAQSVINDVISEANGVTEKTSAWDKTKNAAYAASVAAAQSVLMGGVPLATVGTVKRARGDFTPLETKINREADRVERRPVAALETPETSPRPVPIVEMKVPEPRSAKYSPDDAPSESENWSEDIDPEAEIAAQTEEKADAYKAEDDGEPRFAEAPKESVETAPDPITPEERLATELATRHWMKIFRAIAPQAAAHFNLAVESRAEAATNLGAVPAKAQAAIHESVIYLFKEALAEYSAKGKTRQEVVRRLNHEAAHAWWDTLSPAEKTAIDRLWKAETSRKTGPLYANGAVRSDVMAKVENDVQEWFAERIAHGNDKWAQAKAEIADHDGTLLSRIGAKFRSWIFDGIAAIRPGVSRDVLAKEFRQAMSFNPVKAAKFATAKSSPSEPSIRRIADLNVVTRYKDLTGKTKVDFHAPELSPSRFYMGAADIFEQTPGLQWLGRAVRKHVDTARKYYGGMTAPYRQWSKRHSMTARKQAMQEFEGYWRENERNSKTSTTVYMAASPAGRELIDLWRRTAAEADDINHRNNVQVYDAATREWRPIGRIGNDYFPRMPRKDVLEALGNPRRNPGLYNQVIAELIAGGHIKSADEAGSWISRNLSALSMNDRFGAIEKSRALPLPHMAYDYSFETARRYMAAWSERMGQIEAFGQKVGAAGKDVFDVAAEQTNDKYTVDYIRSVQNIAYGAQFHTPIGRAMNAFNNILTGFMLGNPLTVSLNMTGGLGMIAQAYGTRRTIGALLDLRGAWNSIDDAYEKGVLSDDLMGMMSDAEAAGLFQGAPWHAKTAQALMKYSGFNASETFVRAINLVAAKAMLRDAIRANLKNPESRRAIMYRARLADLVKSPQGVLDEGGSGPLTDEYLRAAVNDIQGGYRYDQTPVFINTPAGKFLLKFQKWGTQQTRYFHRSVALPFIRGASHLLSAGTLEVGGKKIRLRDRSGNVVSRRVPGSIAPMLTYLLIFSAAGEAARSLREWLSRYHDESSSLSEIMQAMSKDQRAALAMLTHRIWLDLVAAGGFGIISNYAQAATDIATQQRFKSPVNPPGLSFARNIGNFALDAYEQGAITPRDIDAFLDQQFSLYRVASLNGARLANEMGSQARAVQAEMRRDDLAWLRSVTRKYNAEVGYAKRTPDINRIPKTPETPFREALKTDLLLGDAASARKRLHEWFSAILPEKRKARVESLMESIQSSQPIKAGTTGESQRVLFIQWAKKNLPPAEIERIKRIDESYRETAKSLGLMDPEPPSTKELLKAMEKLNMRALP